MQFHPDNLYHVYNQGNNRQQTFFQRSEYLTFMNLYKKLIFPHCNTLAWCLMPNHFHFMIHTDNRCVDKIKQGGIFIDSITNGFRKLLSGYARIFNNNNQRTGSLFRQKTKAKCLSDIPLKQGSVHSVRDYFVNCFHYIHQNPLVAGLVTKLEDWEFSSYPDYANIRTGTLCQKELATLYCNYDPVSFSADSLAMVDKKISTLLV
ncbi:MAG TPA: hypothetical protein VF476_18015 [Chitinophagaceae bacterium]